MSGQVRSRRRRLTRCCCRRVLPCLPTQCRNPTCTCDGSAPKVEGLCPQGYCQIKATGGFNTLRELFLASRSYSGPKQGQTGPDRGHYKAQQGTIKVKSATRANCREIITLHPAARSNVWRRAIGCHITLRSMKTGNTREAREARYAC